MDLGEVVDTAVKALEKGAKEFLPAFVVGTIVVAVAKKYLKF